MKLRVDIFGLDQLAKLAEAFSKTLKTPAIVLLKGDLGSGKTTFVKEVARALGCKDLVTSPTFTLLNQYQGKEKIYHFDMYRLSSAEEAEEVGFAEYFDKNTLDGIVFVEWPENVGDLIKNPDFVVEITKTGQKSRRIVIEGEKN